MMSDTEPDHLKIAQHAFEGWLREVDSHLATAALCFINFTQAGERRDTNACATHLSRAEREVLTVRRMIADGLARGA